MSANATVLTTTKSKKATKKSAQKTSQFDEDKEEQWQQQVNSNGAESVAISSKIQKKKLPTEKTEQVATSDVAKTKTTTTTESGSATIEAIALRGTDSSDTNATTSNGSKTLNGKKKSSKAKKSRKAVTDQQNISVKSSFSKFDALQKRSLIHVRSSDAGKAQEKFSNPQGENEINCRLCSKPVYKMEEIKAEKNIYHRNCFRCHECSKQLKVDNYQSHDGVLYCLVHFKLLFAPKYVENSESDGPRKPELIIRENQPEELPPDVVRASDKPDLGLEELQQLNVRSRFQMFENPGAQQREKSEENHPQRISVKHSSSILAKLSKLQAKGITTDVHNRDISQLEGQDPIDDRNDESSASSETDVDSDNDLIRSKQSTKREHPIGLSGRAMSDIRTKFEKGHLMTKEERREERKQEIQNIRSRLFMGKQARIKEMYQQAVADSEQAITSSSKKPEIEIEGAARSIKERFEKGEIFKDHNVESEENGHRTSSIENEADIFESGISKTSRSIFMELDANMAACKNQVNSHPIKPQALRTGVASCKRHNSENEPENIIKYDEKPEDVKIETSEISTKFKFFETYRPSECKKKEFRITPPREGVVKMPTPDSDNEQLNAEKRKCYDENILEKSHTTATMLNKFREMEKSKYGDGESVGPRPLKCFTPPPDGGRRLFEYQESDIDSQEDDYEDNGSEDEEYRHSIDDEALREAQTAARARQLRAKFEKWEACEKQHENSHGCLNIYASQVADDNIESTKTIRERFEALKNKENSLSYRPKYQVNRFV